MDYQKIMSDSLKSLQNAGPLNSHERNYALACEKLRQEHNAKPGAPYRVAPKKKYRG